jgi:hypothetical protein
MYMLSLSLFFASIQSLLIYLYTGFVVMAYYVCFALIFLIWRIINENLLTITVVITIFVTFLCTDFTCFFARSAFLNLILHSWQSYIYFTDMNLVPTLHIFSESVEFFLAMWNVTIFSYWVNTDRYFSFPNTAFSHLYLYFYIAACCHWNMIM